MYFIWSGKSFIILQNTTVLIYRDAEDTKDWINEKDMPLSSTDYGHDLTSVQALQRKHEASERDLAALEEKVSWLSVYSNI